MFHGIPDFFKVIENIRFVEHFDVLPELHVVFKTKRFYFVKGIVRINFLFFYRFAVFGLNRATADAVINFLADFFASVEGCYRHFVGMAKIPFGRAENHFGFIRAERFFYSDVGKMPFARCGKRAEKRCDIFIRLRIFAFKQSASFFGSHGVRA